MQEFDSISVSSYEAESLSARLGERSAQGWSVVSIVAAGSDIVAFLSREGSGAAAEPAAAEPAAAGADSSWSPGTPTTPERAGWGPSGATDSSSGGSWGSSGADTSGAVPTPSTADSSSDLGSGTPSTPSGGGWGQTGSTDSSGGGWGSTSQGATTSSSSSSTPNVPPGWYADPSSRFELRYWDGSAWTEHVSRAGQQHTDPPVA